MEERLDHGVLNVPLAKRGNIDGQIDAFKAAEARRFEERRKLAAREQAEFVSEAQSILGRMSDERVDALRARYAGLTRQGCRRMLLDAVKVHGERALVALRKEAI